MLIYGFFAIGLFIGYISFLLFGSENGVAMYPSLIIGLLGSISSGVLAMAFDVAGEPMYAVVGAICFLFLANAFRSKHEAIYTGEK